MPTRRHFLGELLPALTAGLTAVALDPRRAAAVARKLAQHPGEGHETAADEAFWATVQEAFPVDRSLLNLNNGGVSPSPRPVQEALSRELAFANLAPAHHLWEVIEPRREGIRRRLAGLLGCASEEIAITRNASEGLETCQLGFDLEPGDEVLTTLHDYPRVLNTFEQRVRRDGVVLKTFALPVPAEDPEEVVARFESHLTSRTRLVVVCHMVNITGQILPVAEVVRMARRRRVPVLVDGAHSFAHFPFDHADLGCDYYATSLHKWLFAPFGTGMLFVRRDRIAGLWPLMAAPEHLTDDIRKFEEIGTHPCPNFIAIDSALDFHQSLGVERKAARLVYLRDRWARRLADDARIRLYTSLNPGFACGIATFGIDGIPPKALADFLWRRHRILVAPIERPGVSGVRVSPSVYTTVEEIDRFAGTVEEVLVKGLDV